MRLLVGAYLTETYSDTRVYPAVGVIWEPNDLLCVHLAPPEPRISWFPADDWALHLKFSSSSASWNLDPDTSSTVDQLIFRRFRVGVGIERRIYKNLWATLWGGTNLFQNLEFQDSSERVLFDSDLDAGYYIYAGFHIAAW